MKRVIIALFRSYQKYISPLFAPTCRYYPTCSTYSIQAVEKHGSFKGSLMAIARIMRCHPFAKGGFDLVPNKFSLRVNKASHPNEK